MRSTRLLLLLTVLASLPLGMSREVALAGDGHDEIELRLKSSGIEPSLREGIHESIRRGTKWLLGQMEGRGIQFLAGRPLVHLALVHSGLPEPMRREKAAREAWPEHAFEAQTYTAGLLAMLYQVADPSLPAVKRIHASLSMAPARSGGSWGYRSSGGDGNNLSTAQFGALGLWACERAGAPPDLGAWRLHLRSLLTNQGALGSFAYWWGGRGAAGYPNGSCMGLANLVLAEAALGEPLVEDPRLHLLTVHARHAGRAAFRRHARWILHPRGGAHRNGHPFYSLWALEKAATFLGVEETGGVRWYREGARLLVGSQNTDGSWTAVSGTPKNRPSARRAAGRTTGLAATGRLIQTSFALLFLLRTTDVYRPITPRTAPPLHVVTGRGPTSESGKLTPRPTAPPKALLIRAVRDVRARVERASPADLRPALRSLTLLAKALRLASTDTDVERRMLLVQVEAVLLDVAVPVSRERVKPTPSRVAMALEALEVLREADGRVGSKLLARISDVCFERHVVRLLRVGWYGTCFDVLRALHTPGLPSRLLKRLPTKPRAADVTWMMPLLTTLAGLEAWPGRERALVAAHLMGWAWTHRNAVALRPVLPDVTFALDALVGRPLHDERLNTVRFIEPQNDLRVQRAWLRAHRDPNKAPWK